MFPSYLFLPSWRGLIPYYHPESLFPFGPLHLPAAGLLPTHKPSDLKKPREETRKWRKIETLISETFCLAIGSQGKMQETRFCQSCQTRLEYNLSWQASVVSQLADIGISNRCIYKWLGRKLSVAIKWYYVTMWMLMKMIIEVGPKRQGQRLNSRLGKECGGYGCWGLGI